jgi:type 1 fimbriae regulatory protein FimB/type 1 fimbriae regulatory protein FimE
VLRSREYLTGTEIDQLIKTARTTRNGHRDATLILVAYRHGLRVSELCNLEWAQIDFNAATMYVRRAKYGTASQHPIRGDELRALRRLQREQDYKSAFVFGSEHGGPFTPDAMNRHIKRIGKKAGLSFPIHAHMLRHSCGYALINNGGDVRAIQAYLGHRSLETTVLYTQLSPNAFKDFWRD